MWKSVQPVLFKNHVQLTRDPVPTTIKELLAVVPRGAYTVGRTLGGSRVVGYQAHLQRIATTWKGMMEAAGWNPGSLENSIQATPEHLDGVLKPLLRLGLEAAKAGPLVDGSGKLAGDAGCEFKFMVLVETPEAGGQDKKWESNEEHNPAVYVHWAAQPPVHTGPISVDVRGWARANATLKDSAWVEQRQAFAASAPPNTEEVLLSDPEAPDRLLEGLSSSFLVELVDGTLQTAPKERVLAGIMMQNAERAGKHLTWRHECPSLKEVSNWAGAAVLSNSRTVMPIHTLRWPAARSRDVYDREPGHVIKADDVQPWLSIDFGPVPSPSIRTLIDGIQDEFDRSAVDLNE